MQSGRASFIILSVFFITPLFLGGRPAHAHFEDGKTVKKPTVVVLYTKEPEDKSLDAEDLGKVARFALEEYDKEHSTKTEIELISVDDKDDPQETLKELRKISTKDKPLAIIGPIYSNVAMGLKDYINETKIPMIATFATHNNLTKNSPSIFRICASNRRLVKAMAEYLVPIAQKNKLNIISFKDLADDYSTDLADTFRQSLAGVNLNYNEVLFKGLTGIDNLQDFNEKIWRPTKKDIIFIPDRDAVAAHIIAAMESEPNMVAAIDAVDFVQILKKMKSQKTHIRLVSTYQWLPQKSSYSKKIEEIFKKTFDRNMTINAALTYDATYTAIDAYHRSQNKMIPLTEALHDSTKVTGVTGTIYLDHDGERVFTDQFLKEEIIE